MKANLNDITDFSKEKWQNNETVFDKDEALGIIGDDEEFLKELAEMFINDFPEQISNIKKAIHIHDSNALEKSAHKLKGAVANFGEKAAWKEALRLEMMGRENKLGDVEEAYETLMKETERLVNALREFVKSK
ncbi:MAG: Hpt domain-containing protein [Candidatus Brocadia sp.]